MKMLLNQSKQLSQLSKNKPQKQSNRNNIMDISNERTHDNVFGQI